MNKIERVKAVKAMEFMVRQLNDESQMDLWLEEGVADGDIEYGDLEVRPEDMENLEYWLDDKNFADLMALFIRIMSFANRDGGLYCDGIVST